MMETFPGEAPASRHPNFDAQSNRKDAKHARFSPSIAF